jgi:acyl carrier protein phosphodiesterase
VNYLAHLYLAEDTPESLLGNLMGDFVRGTDLHSYSHAVRGGIQLHRKIDVFTDAHPVVLQSKQRLSPGYRRYAGIAVDIFYDHFLARDWAAYSPVPLPEFASRVYEVLQEHEAMLPERLRRTASFMTAENWLVSYGRVEGVSAALRRASRRLKGRVHLEAMADELVACDAGLETDFRRFFPELRAYVLSVRQA